MLMVIRIEQLHLIDVASKPFGIEEILKCLVNVNAKLVSRRFKMTLHD